MVVTRLVQINSSVPVLSTPADVSDGEARRSRAGRVPTRVRLQCQLCMSGVVKVGTKKGKYKPALQKTWVPWVIWMCIYSLVWFSWLAARMYGNTYPGTLIILVSSESIPPLSLPLSLCLPYPPLLWDVSWVLVWPQTCYVTEDGLEFQILLLCFLGAGWDHRHLPPLLSRFFILSFWRQSHLI